MASLRPHQWVPLLVLPGVLVGAGMFAFTIRKLEKMEMIRGFRPGRSVKRIYVQDKWIDEASPTVWYSVAKGDARVPGPHRLNLPIEFAADYEIGDPIEVINVPGDEYPYHRDDVFADDDNFYLDRVLLVFEAAIALGSLLLAIVLHFALKAFARRSRLPGQQV